MNCESHVLLFVPLSLGTAMLCGCISTEDLFSVLTNHPTYQKLISEYFTPEGVESSPPSSPLTKGKAGNNNAGSPSDNRTALPYKTADNDSPLPSKKND